MAGDRLGSFGVGPVCAALGRLLRHTARPAGLSGCWALLLGPCYRAGPCGLALSSPGPATGRPHAEDPCFPRCDPPPLSLRCCVTHSPGIRTCTALAGPLARHLAFACTSRRPHYLTHYLIR